MTSLGLNQTAGLHTIFLRTAFSPEHQDRPCDNCTHAELMSYWAYDCWMDTEQRQATQIISLMHANQGQCSEGPWLGQPSKNASPQIPDDKPQGAIIFTFSKKLGSRDLTPKWSASVTGGPNSFWPMFQPPISPRYHQESCKISTTREVPWTRREGEIYKHKQGFLISLEPTILPL